MADEPTTPATGDKGKEGAAATAEPPAPETNPATPEVVAGADNPDAVKALIERERAAAKAADDARKAAEAKVQEFEEKDKSELEKLTGKLTKAETKAAEAESKLLRFTVAAEKQIPAEAVDLLQGTTREDLEANADKILELVKSRNANEEKPDFDGGAREPAPDADPEKQHNNDVLKLLGLQPQ